MRTFTYFAAITALLGACTSTPAPPSATTPTPGSAIFDISARSYTVTQNGTTHTLLESAPRDGFSQNGLGLWRWASGDTRPSGYAISTSSQSYADGTYPAIAGGLDNGTYFAGQSAQPSGSVPTSGTAIYAGVYGFVVNGVDRSGPLALTANFGTGVLVDTSPVIDVIGTISGANITGTVSISGESGALSGTFFDDPGGLRVQGAAVGNNMAGVFLAK